MQLEYGVGCLTVNVRLTEMKAISPGLTLTPSESMGLYEELCTKTIMPSTKSALYL